MIHALKTLPEYFEAVIKGEKLFEIRRHDRPFKVGDLLALNEYNGDYTGRSCLVYIDYILDNTLYVKDGYVTMSIKPCAVMKVDKPRNPYSDTYDYSVYLATGEEAGEEE